MITVLQPDVKVPLDRFSDWIAQAGQDYRVIPLQHQPVPDLRECGQGLIILGGRGDAVDTAASPFLPAVYALLQAAIDAELPVLGICLGHQILAHAFDGQVTLAHPTQGEEGPVDIHLGAAGATDTLFAGLPTTFRAAESHHDVVVSLPPAGQLLASSDTCPIQAFRLGSAVGVQFHPEVSPATMGRWSAGDGGDGPAMQALMEREDAAVAAAGQIIAENFTRLITASPAA